MIPWFYLAFSFAILFTLQEGQVKGNAAKIGTFSFRLMAALAILIVIQNLCNVLVWFPGGRTELGKAALFLWAILLDGSINGFRKKDRGRQETALILSRFSLALFAFSYWIFDESAGPARFLRGLWLPPAAGLIQWILGGIWERLRLSEIPSKLRGAPILVWTAMLLALLICKLS